MLAVKVDYKTKQATIGTQAGSNVSTDGILAALESLGYDGKIVDRIPRG